MGRNQAPFNPGKQQCRKSVTFPQPIPPNQLACRTQSVGFSPVSAGAMDTDVVFGSPGMNAREQGLSGILVESVSCVHLR